MNDHGYIERRKDDTKADCGGPFVCDSCTADLIEAVHSEVNPFASLLVRTIDGLGKRVEKLELPWAEANDRLSRMTEESAHFSVAPPNIILEPKDLANAGRQALVKEVNRLEEKCDFLRLHIKARDGENERQRGRISQLERQNSDLQQANNRLLQRARDAEAEYKGLADLIQEYLQASNDRMSERSHQIAAALQDELDNVKEN